MRADTIQTHYDQLETVAARFARSSEASAELSRRLGGRAEALITDGWEGLGANAFAAEIHGEIIPALQRLVDALEAARAVILEVKTILRAAEEDAARLFQGEARAEVPGGAAAGNGVDRSTAGSDGANAVAPNQAGRPDKTIRPRIYIINGINSDGNVPGGYGDDQSVATERLLERYGYDPDQVKSTSAIYLKPQGTQLTGTAFTGTRFGGWASGIDWLTAKGAALVNDITNWRAQTINNAWGSIRGVGEVVDEYLRGEQGRYTQQVYNEIAADLRDNPLLPGQTVILIGHSGGGAVAANVTGMLERNLGVDVSGVITMGAPIANFDEAQRYAEKIVDVRHRDDMLVQSVGPLPIRGAPPGSGGGRPDGSNGNTFILPLYTQTADAHGSYMQDPAVSHEMLRALNKIYPEMNLRITR
jgi:WXG100 family type VII secretion target